MRVIQMNAGTGHKRTVKTHHKAYHHAEHFENQAYINMGKEKELLLKLKKIFSEFDTDDYILAGIIAVLIFEGCDDYILLCVLGYLFIMGIMA